MCTDTNRDRSRTKKKKKNGCHNNSATTFIMLGRFWPRKCKVFIVRKKGGGDGTHTHTHTVQGLSLPVRDSSSLEQMNHSWTQMERGKLFIFTQWILERLKADFCVCLRSEMIVVFLSAPSSWVATDSKDRTKIFSHCFTLNALTEATWAWTYSLRIMRIRIMALTRKKKSECMSKARPKYPIRLEC